MTEPVGLLTYAVRRRVIGKYLGQLAGMHAILALAPLLASILFAEYQATIRYALVAVILAATALLTRRLPVPASIQNNEALCITALAFVLSPVIMIYPLTASGLTVPDALFEAISAVTTTGLTTLPSVTDMPKTFLFARAWMQWYGGLGIVVLSVALLMQSGIVTRQLVDSVSGESALSTTRTYAQRMFKVYLGLTLCGFLLLWLVLPDAFLALTHTLSAISTGGFSPLDRSLAALDNWPARFAVMLLGLLGAVPFVLYYRAVKGKWTAAVTDMELRSLLVAVLLTGLLLAWSLHVHLPQHWPESLAHGLLMGFSAQTTTGFASLDIAQLDTTSKLIMIIAMFCGGGVGSTAGGIKLLRLLILFRLIFLIIQRTAMPSHAVTQTSIGGRLLDDDDIIRALVLILLFMAVILLSWLLFLVHGYPSMDALFEVVSATGTVGLSTGITRTGLEPVLKLVLELDMLLGRLEIIALLIVLYPRTWIGKRIESL